MPAKPNKAAPAKMPTYTDTIGVTESNGSALIPMPAAPTDKSTKSGDATATNSSPAASIPSTALAGSDAVVAAGGSKNVASPQPLRTRNLQSDSLATSSTAPAPLAMVSVSNATVDPNTVTSGTAAGSADASVTDPTVANVSTTNTASRMEAMTKGTPHSLFLAESTREALTRTNPDLVFVDELPVRGREAPIRLWSIAPEPEGIEERVTPAEVPAPATAA